MTPPTAIAAIASFHVQSCLVYHRHRRHRAKAVQGIRQLLNVLFPIALVEGFGHLFDGGGRGGGQPYTKLPPMPPCVMAGGGGGAALHQTAPHAPLCYGGRGGGQPYTKLPPMPPCVMAGGGGGSPTPNCPPCPLVLWREGGGGSPTPNCPPCPLVLWREGGGAALHQTAPHAPLCYGGRGGGQPYTKLPPMPPLCRTACNKYYRPQMTMIKTTVATPASNMRLLWKSSGPCTGPPPCWQYAPPPPRVRPTGPMNTMRPNGIPLGPNLARYQFRCADGFTVSCLDTPILKTKKTLLSCSILRCVLYAALQTTPRRGCAPARGT